MLEKGKQAQGCQKVFKKQADNEKQAALELAPKAKVLEGRGIQGHFEIQSLGNGFSRGFSGGSFHETGKNDVEMYQVFHNIG